MNLVVIGGGAAGFFGAITAAEANPHCRVTLLERNATPLGKVRISGGGRCNVTHACFEPSELIQHYPRGGRALLGPLTRFQPRDVIAWFESRGVPLKTERDGRVFPMSDRAESIVNCLLESAQRAGVAVQTSANVLEVLPEGNAYTVVLKDRSRLPADRLLLATGSSTTGWRIAQALGHTIVPPVPSLFTFEIRTERGEPDPRLDGLAGIAVAHVGLTLLAPDGLPCQRQQGALLITHWGLSGPVVLRLSAFAARELHDWGYRAWLLVDWLPQLTESDLQALFVECKHKQGGRLVCAHSPLRALPHRLWSSLCAEAQVYPDQRWAKLPRGNMQRLTEALKRGRYLITGKSPFKEEFVTCGGVCLDEVNFRTMESRIAPGVYFAGEVLDVDGVTGGFNFQAAWTTGWVAGQAIAASSAHTCSTT
ncbi:MAG: NAD(P)/FAD-dependent oxidoreductase [Anaerolineae bacterium]|nr:NAD(P)/FAD-dependent oxidoreductase [Thermoflexales bacterium]MDW8395891.1 NAD(P)/FAD-dependent oxidoreductase [Anaerolineae bacterium]